MKERRSNDGEDRDLPDGATPKPCPFSATVSLPDRLPENEPQFCEFHAAILPLVDEVDELGVSQAYLKAARRHPGAAALVAVLEYAEADFSERRGLLDKSLRDLKAAEQKLIRGQNAK